MTLGEVLLVCLRDCIGDGTTLEDEDYDDDDGEQDNHKG